MNIRIGLLIVLLTVAIRFSQRPVLNLSDKTADKGPLFICAVLGGPIATFFAILYCCMVFAEKQFRKDDKQREKEESQEGGYKDMFKDQK